MSWGDWYYYDLPGQQRDADAGVRHSYLPKGTDLVVGTDGCGQPFTVGLGFFKLLLFNYLAQTHAHEVFKSDGRPTGCGTMSSPDFCPPLPVCNYERGISNPSVYGFAYTSTYSIHIRNLTQFVLYL